MKLIGRYDSPYVRRVGVSLHVLGLPFEHVPLSPFSQATELRKFSSIGRMPALVLDGDVLIESAAILDHLDEIVGPERALIAPSGAERRRCLKVVATATAACDKAIAVNYERRRPKGMIYTDWIARCREQLDAALRELEAFGLVISDCQPLTQSEITVACAYAYIGRVEPDAVANHRYPCLEQLGLSCEAKPPFLACPQ